VTCADTAPAYESIQLINELNVPQPPSFRRTLWLVSGGRAVTCSDVRSSACVVDASGFMVTDNHNTSSARGNEG
jgi:hypothetical protein